MQRSGAVAKWMAGLAWFRIGLGAASWIAPGRVGRLYGLTDKQITPELEYMTRVFGIRAVALGTGYLASGPEARPLWHRLWLLCDAGDTVMGTQMLARGELPLLRGVAALATTAPAMALDATAIAAGE
jgi:hypothetical protein